MNLCLKFVYGFVSFLCITFKRLLTHILIAYSCQQYHVHLFSDLCTISDVFGFNSRSWQLEEHLKKVFRKQ